MNVWMQNSETSDARQCSIKTWFLFLPKMVVDSAPFGCGDITSDCDSVAIFTSLLQKAIGILAGSTFFRVTHQEIERALNNVGKKGRFLVLWEFAILFSIFFFYVKHFYWHR